MIEEIMDTVDKVAAAIAEIPGNPTHREIARIAIEEYQNEIWSPTFKVERGRILPEYRMIRAMQLTSHIMRIVRKYLCDHDGTKGHKGATQDLMEVLYESGAEVITDADRAVAGLPARGPYGLTAEELGILEMRRVEAMLGPV